MRRAADLAPPALLALLGLAQIAGIPAGDEFAGPAWVDATFLVLCVIPLVRRRTHPGPVLLAVVVANLLWTEVVFAPTDEVVLETWFVMLVALWSVVVFGTRRDDLPYAVAALVLELGVGVLEVLRGVPIEQQAVPFVSFFVAVAAAASVRRQRSTNRLLRQRTRELEEEREARAREAVDLERARIARELHDLVTHGLTGVILHAGAERERLAESDTTGQTLATIEQLARTSLADLRRLLGLLRTSADGLSPQPGLGAIGDLVQSARLAGLRVELVDDEDPAVLDPALELNAYRIVQEAMTNAIKHAPGSAVRIVVRREPHALLLRVDNDRCAVPPTSCGPSGHGLVGLRERVRLFAGNLQVGPRPEGGFRVDVALPLAAGDR